MSTSYIVADSGFGADLVLNTASYVVLDSGTATETETKSAQLIVVDSGTCYEFASYQFGQTSSDTGNGSDSESVEVTYAQIFYGASGKIVPDGPGRIVPVIRGDIEFPVTGGVT